MSGGIQRSSRVLGTELQCKPGQLGITTRCWHWSRRVGCPELDEQRPEFLAGKPELPGTSLLFRLVLQHAVIDDAEPVPCEHRDDLAVALPLCDLVVSDGELLRLHVGSRLTGRRAMSLLSTALRKKIVARVIGASVSRNALSITKSQMAQCIASRP
jgi:hypothetical protein